MSPMSPTSPSERHHTSSGSSKVFVASMTKTSAPTTGSKHSTNSTSSLVDDSGEDEVRVSTVRKSSLHVNVYRQQYLYVRMCMCACASVCVCVCVCVCVVYLFVCVYVFCVCV